MITRPKEWTLWRVRREMSSIVEELQEEKRQRGKPITYFAKTIFARRGLHSEIVRRWGIEYGDDPQIRAAVHLMKDILESRSVEGALLKQIDPFVAIFNLKNNYGWKEDPGQSDRDEQRLNIDIENTNRRMSDARKGLLPQNQRKEGE